MGGFPGLLLLVQVRTTVPDALEVAFRLLGALGMPSLGIRVTAFEEELNTPPAIFFIINVYVVLFMMLIP